LVDLGDKNFERYSKMFLTLLYDTVTLRNKIALLLIAIAIEIYKNA